jgi:hypothetical protein
MSASLSASSAAAAAAPPGGAAPAAAASDLSVTEPGVPEPWQLKPNGYAKRAAENAAAAAAASAPSASVTAAAAAASAAAAAVPAVLSSLSCVDVSLKQPQILTHSGVSDALETARSLTLKCDPIDSGVPKHATAVRCELLFWARTDHSEIVTKDKLSVLLVRCTVSTCVAGAVHAIHTHARDIAPQPQAVHFPLMHPRYIAPQAVDFPLTRAEFWLPVGPSDAERVITISFAGIRIGGYQNGVQYVSGSIQVEPEFYGECDTTIGVMEKVSMVSINAYRTGAGIAVVAHPGAGVPQQAPPSVKPPMPAWAAYDHSKSEADNFAAMATRFAMRKT